MEVSFRNESSIEAEQVTRLHRALETAHFVPIKNTKSVQFKFQISVLC